MKRFLKGLAIVVVVAGILVFAFDEQIKQFVYDGLTDDMFVAADTDEFDPGPLLGSHFPGVNASYRGRELKLINEFYGENGTVFIATRSADWCPYCMRQMVQLQEYKQRFDAAGIGMVAMTYDDPALQQAFIDKWTIEYPILHDIDALSFITLGILNEKYQKGDSAYGIPHPGMIVVDSGGIVVGKQFLEDYSVRVDSGASLEFAKKALGLTGG